MRSNQTHWILSDQGAAAVLLKMDEFQQRLNTPSALIQKGKHTQPVLAPQTIPKLYVPKVPDGIFSALPRESTAHQQVLQKLRHAINNKQCDRLHDPEFEQHITPYPLNKQQTLVETTCKIYPYNYDNLYVIMDNTLQTIHSILPEGSNTYSNSSGAGELSATHKVRGLGDCWSNETQVWNGKQFVATQANHNQLCRGFAGGAWHMPSLITNVITE